MKTLEAIVLWWFWKRRRQFEFKERQRIATRIAQAETMQATCIPLNKALLCESCQTIIQTNGDSCPRCESRSMMRLDTALARKAITEQQLVNETVEKLLRGGKR